VYIGGNGHNTGLCQTGMVTNFVNQAKAVLLGQMQVKQDQVNPGHLFHDIKHFPAG
jgi:hypothetical protein